MTTTRRRLHRTTFGLGQAQHRAALDVASVIKSVERDRKLSDARGLPSLGSGATSPNPVAFEAGALGPEQAVQSACDNV